MRNHILLFAALIAVIFVSGCGRSGQSNGKMIVAASIPPMASFAKAVGGRYVDVTLMVPAGANPHTYQIGPEQMRTLSRASVLILNGLSFEFWADKAIESAGNRKMIVVRTSDGLKVLEKGQEEDHPQGNPHVWLDPINAIHQVNMICDAFIKADPKHAKAYKANAQAYIAKLKTLDSYIKSQVAQFKSRDFIAAHSSWVYFAHRYGLRQVGAIEESPGKEPTPAELNRIIKIARKNHVRAVFSEPQLPPKPAQVIAQEVGAKVLTLDPLGAPPDYDYLKTMRENIREIAKALK